MELGVPHEAIAGEVAHLLAVEREIEAMLERARAEADGVRSAAEAEREALERERMRALEEEVAAKKREIRAAVDAEIERLNAGAIAETARYELSESRVAELADRIAEWLAGDEP